MSKPPGSIPDAESLPERMRRDLTQARRARDQAAMSALRTTLAAMANAEAPPVPLDAAHETGSHPRPPSPPGWRPDVAPLPVSEADLEAIVVAEIADRRHTITLYIDHDRHAEADELERQIDVLATYLS